MDITFIVIVTYNANPWLNKCLGSVDFSKYKVVVIDNNSQDNTVEIIKSRFPDVKLFQEKENLGFGQANNKGISYALNHGAKQVFLLNQDAYLIDDCLEQLIKQQIQNPEFGVLSPIHTNAEITRLDRNFSNYMSYDMNPDFYSDFVLNKKPKPVYEVPFVNAAGWLLSKECLLKVGGFDPIFFHYGEDRNFAQRLIYHGFKMGVLSNCYMIHDREEREIFIPKKNTKEYLELFERNLKVKYGDINTNSIIELEDIIKKKKSKLLKLKFKAKFNSIQILRKELDIYMKVFNECSLSRKLNLRSFPNYLNIDLH